MDSHRKGKAAFQYHPVGGYGGENIIHPGKGVDNALTVHRSGQVEKDYIILHPGRHKKFIRRFYRFVR